MELWIHVDCKYMPPAVTALEHSIAGWASEGASGVVFEWENMFPYPKLGDAVRKDAYSSDAVERILGACRKVGLKAIPLVQTFGHLEWILAHERYRRLREFDHVKEQIKACDRESEQLIKDKIEALLEAHHDSPYVHLGADEAYHLASIDRPDCSSAVEGPCNVFLRHMTPFIDKVVNAGKRPVIWADMPLRYPENIDDFPREVVFCDWRYGTTAEHGSSVIQWGAGSVSADNYDDVPPERRRLFEKYWSIGARNFPDEFYQFPYMPFLRDRGYDVLAGPATLYAGNALAGPDLPKARANGREWLRAADRFGAMGALNTCWAVRGAFREATRSGHRAFLLQGRLIDSLPGDREVSISCLRPAAGEKAEKAAELVDRLKPPVDDVSCTKPLYFDAENRTHRPTGYDRRKESIDRAVSQIDESDSRPEAYRDAVGRGRRTAHALAALKAACEEVKAWELGAEEVAVRAEAWLALCSKMRGRRPETDPEIVMKNIKALSARVEDFMKGRYMDSDITLVCKDRYDSLNKLLASV